MVAVEAEHSQSRFSYQASPARPHWAWLPYKYADKELQLADSHRVETSVNYLKEVAACSVRAPYMKCISNGVDIRDTQPWNTCVIITMAAAAGLTPKKLYDTMMVEAARLVSGKPCNGCQHASNQTELDTRAASELNMAAKPPHLHCHKCGVVAREQMNGVFGCCGEEAHPTTRWNKDPSVVVIDTAVKFDNCTLVARHANKRDKLRFCNARHEETEMTRRSDVTREAPCHVDDAEAWVLITETGMVTPDNNSQVAQSITFWRNRTVQPIKKAIDWDKPFTAATFSKVHAPQIDTAEKEISAPESGDAEILVSAQGGGYHELDGTVVTTITQAFSVKHFSKYQLDDLTEVVTGAENVTSSIAKLGQTRKCSTCKCCKGAACYTQGARTCSQCKAKRITIRASRRAESITASRAGKSKCSGGRKWCQAADFKEGNKTCNVCIAVAKANTQNRKECKHIAEVVAADFEAAAGGVEAAVRALSKVTASSLALAVWQTATVSSFSTMAVDDAEAWVLVTETGMISPDNDSEVAQTKVGNANISNSSLHGLIAIPSGPFRLRDMGIEEEGHSQCVQCRADCDHHRFMVPYIKMTNDEKGEALSALGSNERKRVMRNMNSVQQRAALAILESRKQVVASCTTVCSRHKRRKLNGDFAKEEGVHRCVVCGEEFDNPDNLKRHWNVPCIAPCIVCNKVFEDLSELLFHEAECLDGNEDIPCIAGTNNLFDMSSAAGLALAKEALSSVSSFSCNTCKKKGDLLESSDVFKSQGKVFCSKECLLQDSSFDSQSAWVLATETGMVSSDAPEPCLKETQVYSAIEYALRSCIATPVRELKPTESESEEDRDIKIANIAGLLYYKVKANATKGLLCNVTEVQKTCVQMRIALARTAANNAFSDELWQVNNLHNLWQVYNAAAWRDAVHVACRDICRIRAATRTFKLAMADEFNQWNLCVLKQTFHQAVVGHNAISIRGQNISEWTSYANELRNAAKSMRPQVIKREADAWKKQLICWNEATNIELGTTVSQVNFDSLIQWCEQHRGSSVNRAWKLLRGAAMTLVRHASRMFMYRQAKLAAAEGAGRQLNMETPIREALAMYRSALSAIRERSSEYVIKHHAGLHADQAMHCFGLRTIWDASVRNIYESRQLCSTIDCCDQQESFGRAACCVEHFVKNEAGRNDTKAKKEFTMYRGAVARIRELKSHAREGQVKDRIRGDNEEVACRRCHQMIHLEACPRGSLFKQFCDVCYAKHKLECSLTLGLVNRQSVNSQLAEMVFKQMIDSEDDEPVTIHDIIEPLVRCNAISDDAAAEFCKKEDNKIQAAPAETPGAATCGTGPEGEPLHIDMLNNEMEEPIAAYQVNFNLSPLQRYKQARLRALDPSDQTEWNERIMQRFPKRQRSKSLQREQRSRNSIVRFKPDNSKSDSIEWNESMSSSVSDTEMRKAMGVTNGTLLAIEAAATPTMGICAKSFVQSLPESMKLPTKTAADIEEEHKSKNKQSKMSQYFGARLAPVKP